MHTLQAIIDDAWERRNAYKPGVAPSQLVEAVESVLNDLDVGKLRVAEKVNVPVPSDLPGAAESFAEQWVTHQWIKKAVLLSFRLRDNEVMGGCGGRYFDKVDSKFAGWDLPAFQKAGFRVVPPASVRHGAYVAKNVILMPSYVNIGAYVGEGTMVDTWATVGSCAQVGKNCHLGGGVGIGGVLEPVQNNPTTIEDNVFIGARSEIVEGVVVEENSVISMGVFIGQSTPIVNRDTGEVTTGRIPAGSVVIPGAMPMKCAPSLVGLGKYCVIIIKQVDAKTRAKTAINELLRD